MKTRQLSIKGNRQIFKNGKRQFSSENQESSITGNENWTQGYNYRFAAFADKLRKIIQMELDAEHGIWPGDISDAFDSIYVKGKNYWSAEKKLRKYPDVPFDLDEVVADLFPRALEIAEEMGMDIGADGSEENRHVFVQEVAGNLFQMNDEADLGIKNHSGFNHDVVQFYAEATDIADLL